MIETEKLIRKINKLIESEGGHKISWSEDNLPKGVKKISIVFEINTKK